MHLKKILHKTGKGRAAALMLLWGLLAWNGIGTVQAEEAPQPVPMVQETQLETEAQDLQPETVAQEAQLETISQEVQQEIIPPEELPKLQQSFAGIVKPWLFYKEAYYDRQKPFQRGKELWWYKKVIGEKLYTPLTQNGIRLVLMVVPDKDTLYGEDYLPEELKAPLRQYNRVDQFLDYMRENFPELEIYYAKEDMLRAKEKGLPLYYASDSHWNFVGAGACAEGLMAYLGEGYQLPEKPVLSYELTGETARGDLQDFEGLDDSYNRVEYRVEGAWPAEKVYTFSDSATGEEIYAGYRSLDSRALPKKLYFCGDSYRWYIQYILNGQFAESWFVQRYQFSAADAITRKPDVFIYELPERFLPQLGSLIS